MKKTVLIGMLSLFSTVSFAGDTAVHREVAPTIAQAQDVVDSIHAGRTRVHDCSQGGRMRVYDVQLPNPLTTTRINRFGEIEVVAAKTIFKVNCNINSSR